MLGKAGKSIQPGLEVPARATKLEAGHQPRGGSAPQGYGAAVAGSRSPAGARVGSTAGGGRVAGDSTLPGGQEQRRRRNVHWGESGVNIAGPGQGGGGNWKGTLAVLRLATAWVDLGSDCSLNGN